MQQYNPERSRRRIRLRCRTKFQRDHEDDVVSSLAPRLVPPPLCFPELQRRSTDIRNVSTETKSHVQVTDRHEAKAANVTLTHAPITLCVTLWLAVQWRLLIEPVNTIYCILSSMRGSSHMRSLHDNAPKMTVQAE